MVFERIGVHFEHLGAQKRFVLIRKIDFVQLLLQVCFEAHFIAPVVMTSKAHGSVQHIVSHMVAGIKAVVGIDVAVDGVCNFGNQLVASHVAIEVLQRIVQR